LDGWAHSELHWAIAFHMTITSEVLIHSWLPIAYSTPKPVAHFPTPHVALAPRCLVLVLVLVLVFVGVRCLPSNDIQQHLSTANDINNHPTNMQQHLSTPNARHATPRGPLSFHRQNHSQILRHQNQCPCLLDASGHVGAKLKGAGLVGTNLQTNWTPAWALIFLPRNITPWCTSTRVCALSIVI